MRCRTTRPGDVPKTIGNDWDRFSLEYSDISDRFPVTTPLMSEGNVVVPCSEQWPGEAWQPIADPAAVGWSPGRLEAARAYAQEIGSLAVVVVAGGALLGAWGEPARPFNVRSIRKCLLGCLYGFAVAEGHIPLRATLEEFSVDDAPSRLMAEERRATIADLLTARSGVYLPANYQSPEDRAALPPRASHPPGTFWSYNNWDFNALGTIFEQRTGERIFSSFERRVARPLAMQDFRQEACEYVGGPDSLHPAYIFRLSAHDLARFGLLYQRAGRWRGRQLVPSGWVEESTQAHAVIEGGPGFGYLWWVAVAGRLLPALTLPDGSFASLGVGGQFLLVVPALDLVVAHLCDPDGSDAGESPLPPSPEQMCRLLELILAARSG